MRSLPFGTTRPLTMKSVKTRRVVPGIPRMTRTRTIVKIYQTKTGVCPLSVVRCPLLESGGRVALSAGIVDSGARRCTFEGSARQDAREGVSCLDHTSGLRARRIARAFGLSGKRQTAFAMLRRRRRDPSMATAEIPTITTLDGSGTDCPVMRIAPVMFGLLKTSVP